MKKDSLKVKKVNYKAVKFNKTNVIYSGIVESSNILTEEIKLEQYQGFSKAFNVSFYLVVKNKPKWKDSKKVTGLFKLIDSFFFYGDYKNNNSKTTLLFRMSPEMKEVIIYEFPEGVYLSKRQLKDFLRYN